MAKKSVPKKKKGICVIKDMAAGMTKTEARKDCDVGKSPKPGKKAHKKHIGKTAKAPKPKCHGKVHVRSYERSCPHK